MMSEHLSGVELNSMADGELSAEQMAEVNAHLAGGSACTTNALSQMMLKSATARAGQRYALPDDVRERLLQKVAKETAQMPVKASGSRAGWLGWTAAAAMLLTFLGVGLMQRRAAV